MFHKLIVVSWSLRVPRARDRVTSIFTRDHVLFSHFISRPPPFYLDHTETRGLSRVFSSLKRHKDDSSFSPSNSAFTVGDGVLVSKLQTLLEAIGLKTRVRSSANFRAPVYHVSHVELPTQHLAFSRSSKPPTNIAHAQAFFNIPKSMLLL